VALRQAQGGAVAVGSGGKQWQLAFLQVIVEKIQL
jgi:hypothetical protein